MLFVKMKLFKVVNKKSKLFIVYHLNVYRYCFILHPVKACHD